MNTKLLQLWCMAALCLSGLSPLLPADVAPPGAMLLVITLYGLFWLGIIILGIAIISFVVLRVIKKKQARRGDG